MELLSEVDVSGKSVFVRADLDVNLANVVAGSGADAVRLTNLKPTFDYLSNHGVSQIVIAGHVGRPQGQDPKFSMSQLVGSLSKILNCEIVFRKDFESEVNGKVILFENLRFWPGEEANDPNFAKQLAGFANIYVNDAFGVSHRAHASVVGVPLILPHAAGTHLELEIDELSEVMQNSVRPFVAIVGGAKIETKLPVLEHLIKIADTVLVGGEIAEEYQAAKLEGQLDPDKIVVADSTDDQKDISSDSSAKFAQIIKGAKTVVWNGPMGVFEQGFDAGTLAVARAVIDSGAHSVVGGGDTTEFLASKNLLGKFSFVSSGGGAMLEFLAGKELPGIKALE